MEKWKRSCGKMDFCIPFFQFGNLKWNIECKIPRFFRFLPSHRKVIHIRFSQNTLCKRLFIHIRELLAEPNTICMCKRANFNVYRVVFLIRNFCLPPLVPDDLVIRNLDKQPPLLLLGMCQGIKLWPKREFQGTFWPENKAPPPWNSKMLIFLGKKSAFGQKCWFFSAEVWFWIKNADFSREKSDFG